MKYIVPGFIKGLPTLSAKVMSCTTTCCVVHYYLLCRVHHYLLCRAPLPVVSCTTTCCVVHHYLLCRVPLHAASCAPLPVVSVPLQRRAPLPVVSCATAEACTTTCCVVCHCRDVHHYLLLCRVPLQGRAPVVVAPRRCSSRAPIWFPGLVSTVRGKQHAVDRRASAK